MFSPITVHSWLLLAHFRSSGTSQLSSLSSSVIKLKSSSLTSSDTLVSTPRTSSHTVDLNQPGPRGAHRGGLGTARTLLAGTGVSGSNPVRDQLLVWVLLTFCPGDPGQVLGPTKDGQPAHFLWGQDQRSHGEHWSVASHRQCWSLPHSMLWVELRCEPSAGGPKAEAHYSRNRDLGGISGPEQKGFFLREF